ncbi:MAG: amidinotransferase [Pirellulales bacterium]|nr:amidinotransferase [Pirellulales bacterium]
MRRILMCPPEHYGIHYEINPWMSRERPSDRHAALEQWERLTGLIRAAGAEIEQLSPVAGLPDLVFTANAGLIFGRRVVLAHFRHPERQGEEPHDRAWFSAAGFEVVEPPPATYFEGAGDALFCGDTLFAGYRLRSDARGMQEIGQMLGVRVIPLELVDPYYYHLDTCFCPLAPGAALWYPAAFDEYGRRVIGELVPDLISVAEEEARSFACNAVVIGRTVITNTGCPKMHAELRRREFEPVETPLAEFVKAGGSAKCLTLRLDGEEAAAWRAAG